MKNGSHSSLTNSCLKKKQKKNCLYYFVLQQFSVFTTERRCSSAISKRNGPQKRKTNFSVLGTSAYTSEFSLCDCSRSVVFQVLALLLLWGEKTWNQK